MQNTRQSCRKFSRRIAAAVTAIVITFDAGCSLQPRKSGEPVVSEIPQTAFQTELGNVAIVPLVQAPKSEFQSLARGKGEAASRMAGQGLSGCLKASVSDGRGIFIWIFAPEFVMGTCATIGAAAGGVGAIKAPSAEAVKKSEAAIGNTQNSSFLSELLLKQISGYAQADGIHLVTFPPEKADVTKTHDYRSLASAGIDTVLEIDLTQYLTPNEPDGLNPIFFLVVDADVRLFRTKDNAVLFSENYLYNGKQLKYAEWSENNAERLLDTLKSDYEFIWRNVSDRISVLYPFPDRAPHGNLKSCGLAPIASYGKQVAAGDLQPLLSWQTFPRDTDIAASPAEMAQVQDVRYDLIIGQGESGDPLGVAYLREGLSSANHKIAEALKPNTSYYWSARARFKLDGRERVTEWGMICPFEQKLIAGGGLYRFKTREE